MASAADWAVGKSMPSARSRVRTPSCCGAVNPARRLTAVSRQPRSERTLRSSGPALRLPRARRHHAPLRTRRRRGWLRITAAGEPGQIRDVDPGIIAHACATTSRGPRLQHRRPQPSRLRLTINASHDRPSPTRQKPEIYATFHRHNAFRQNGDRKGRNIRRDSRS